MLALGAPRRRGSRRLGSLRAAALRRSEAGAPGGCSSAGCSAPRRRRRSACRPSRAPVSTRVSEPRRGPPAGACAASRRPPPASHPALQPFRRSKNRLPAGPQSSHRTSPQNFQRSCPKALSQLGSSLESTARHCSSARRVATGANVRTCIAGGSRARSELERRARGAAVSRECRISGRRRRAVGGQWPPAPVWGPPPAPPRTHTRERARPLAAPLSTHVSHYPIPTHVTPPTLYVFFGYLHFAEAVTVAVMGRKRYTRYSYQLK